MLTRRARDRAALTIAVLATLLAVVLSVAPVLSDSPARYSPQLAVLTATLIAVIWYTYFTYLAVNREERSVVVYELRYDPGDYSVDVELQNPTRRTIAARVQMRLFLDDTEVENLPPAFAGGLTRLTPLKNPTHHLDLPPLIHLYGEPAPSGYLPPRFSRIRAEIEITWTDDLGEEGRIGPEEYEGPLNQPLQVKV